MRNDGTVDLFSEPLSLRPGAPAKNIRQEWLVRPLDELQNRAAVRTSQTVYEQILDIVTRPVGPDNDEGLVRLTPEASTSVPCPTHRTPLRYTELLSAGLPYTPIRSYKFPLEFNGFHVCALILPLLFHVCAPCLSSFFHVCDKVCVPINAAPAARRAERVIRPVARRPQAAPF